jgi:adenylate cyclase
VGPLPERTVPGRWIVLAIVIFATIGVSFAIHWMNTRAGTNPPPPPSIAVLPFNDMSAEKNQEDLCDGIAAQIIDDLSRIPGFQVVPRSSVSALKGRPQDAREIGRQLSVRTVLQGSVQRSGSRVRVTAQLINTSDGFHLWSESYDRDVKDISALEAEISHSVADTLQIK